MKTKNKLPIFSKNLLAWYDKQGRKNLPWREKISAYYVWVSEIMLQQTQVKTVIPYFNQFIARFPTLIDLANASEDAVLHQWTGLGYYARARYLHHTAKTIVSTYQGLFPSTLETLQSLKGIGRSTAGAILAIAFNQQAAILDGNVKRILLRFYAIEGLASDTKINQQLWAIAQQHTPAKRTADYTQAIMDLGATVCLRTKPLCHICPISRHCQAYLHNKQSELPTPKTRTSTPLRTTYVLIFHHAKTNTVLLEKRPATGIWAGLWSFPECPMRTNITQWSQDQLNLRVDHFQRLQKFKHVFTHFQLNISPVYILMHRKKETSFLNSKRYIWYSLDKPIALGLPAPIKKLLQSLKEG
jgi:A/G-specific adenine glycosylase